MKKENSNSSIIMDESRNKKSTKDKLQIYLSLIFIFFLLLIIYILIFYDLYFSLIIKQKRRLSSYYSYETSETSKKESEEIDDTDVFSFILLVCYIFFIVLSLYIICQIKMLSEKAGDVVTEIFKFMYMSNNGYLFVSAIDTSVSKAGAAIGSLGVSSLIFTIGTIIYLVKFLKVIVVGFFDTYFSFDMVLLWLGLPIKYVWPFMFLTDPCCFKDTYTIYHHSDGTVTSDKSLVICWNKCMWLIKRFAFIISTVLYYVFFFILILFWLIIKLIIVIIKKICQSKENGKAEDNDKGNIPDIKNQNEPPVTVVGYENNNNLENNNKIMNFRRQNPNYMTRNSSINATNHINSVEALNSKNSNNINIHTRRTFIKRRANQEYINNNQNVNLIIQNIDQNIQTNINEKNNPILNINENKIKNMQKETSNNNNLNINRNENSNNRNNRINRSYRANNIIRERNKMQNNIAKSVRINQNAQNNKREEYGLNDKQNPDNIYNKPVNRLHNQNELEYKFSTRKVMRNNDEKNYGYKNNKDNNNEPRNTELPGPEPIIQEENQMKENNHE